MFSLAEINPKRRRAFGVLVIGVSLLLACDSGRRIEIRLPQDQRLESTVAGWWLRELGLQHETKDLLQEVRQALLKKGDLIDEYVEDKNILVKQWRIPVSRQRLRTRDGHIYVYEKRADDRYWFDVSFGPEGINWLSMLVDHAEQRPITSEDIEYLLKAKRRQYAHAVTIVSPGEYAKLFLFGWGGSCVEVSLVDGS
jgi:hypothetical protein